MKKTLIFFFCLAQVFISCEDYLEVESPSAFDTDYVFSNSAEAKKMLLGVYSLFGNDAYSSRMAFVWMQNTDVEATQPSANPDGSRRDVWSLQSHLLSGWSDIKKAWDNNYLAIDRANQCIDGIKSSSFYAKDADMKHMLGEAYCLKAYRYYLLCNYWGDVPYFSYAAKAGLELDIPKADKNLIYSQCIQDIVNTEEDMYFADEFTDGIERMNREFAMGLIARLSLFRAGYGMTQEGLMKRADDYLDVTTDTMLAVTYKDILGTVQTARTSNDYYKLASDYCQKLIKLRDRNLNPDFSKIFTNESKFVKTVNDDVLYEVAFLAQKGGDVGWAIGSVVTGGSKGKTTIQTYLTPSYYFSFDDEDLRKDITFSMVEYTSDTEEEVASIRSLAIGKWNRLLLNYESGPNSSKGTGINWPLMRYSDVLLMLAEAENEMNGGPNTLATDALKRVRRRAFPSESHSVKVDSYVANIMSKDDFFNAIVDERAWEFGGECLRRFDLIRWNNYGQKIVETKKVIDNIGKAANGIDITDPEVSQYLNYANKLYYRLNNGKVEYLNTKYRPTEVPELIVPVDDLGIEGNEEAYASVSWASGLYKNSTDKDGNVIIESADYTQYCWRGYPDESGVSPVPYILPISVSTIGASKYLNNSGYGLDR